MISLDSSEVFVQGDEPSEILWRGKQWAVTVEGIEALDGTYYIGKERLLEERGGLAVGTAARRKELVRY
ncbi:hypothetical protein [Devosia riboflavina]